MNITRAKLKETLRTIVNEESEYQSFFKAALEKAGKSIPDMSEEEKKAFFNKIDAAWDAKGEKNEALVGGQKKLDIDGDGDIGADDLADLRAGKKADESVNEEEIRWNAVENAIINFLKVNTKILDKRVQAKDTDGVKGGLKSIISGLTNAQRSLKLESVNEASYVSESTESVNEITLSQALKSVSKGETSSVEGIKMSRTLANGIANWAMSSPYGMKYGKAMLKAPIGASWKMILSPNFGVEKYLSRWDKAQLQKVKPELDAAKKKLGL